MKMSYFENTDTLYIEFNSAAVVDSRDLTEDTLIDLDANGGVVAITTEQASRRADLRRLVLEGLAA